MTNSMGSRKMSTREALGYLVQLRDLYWLRLTSGRRAPKEYSRSAPPAGDRGATVGVKPTGA